MHKEAIGRSIEKFVKKPVKFIKANEVNAGGLGIGLANVVMGNLRPHDSPKMNSVAIGIGIIVSLAAIIGIQDNWRSPKDKNGTPQTLQSK